MKILYVEDELSKNIPKIIKLFSKYLDGENIKELKTLEEDEYGALEEKIKTIVEKSNIIEIEYRFPEALYKIMNNYKQYSLFIIDRNLSDTEAYELDEIAEIDPNYNQRFYNHFYTREGDYLLQKLVYDIDIKSQFYFLTANNDELRISSDVQTHINNEKFSKDNFIEKGNPMPLIQVINNIEILNLQVENQIYIEILRNKVGERAFEKFVHILSKKDSEEQDDIAENLGAIRNILENILTNFAGNFMAPSWCWNIKNKTQIIVKSVIAWINPFDKKTNKYNYNYNSNSIIRNFMSGIHDIASDFASHEDLKNYKQMIKPTGYQPTVNTVNALIYELKDIILWFDKIC